MKSNIKTKIDDLKIGGALFVTVLALFQTARLIILSTL